MEDYIIRATAADGNIRALAINSTNIVKEARRIHGLSPLASAALGRTLTGAALMSKMLKGEKETITIQIKGNGPLGGMVVTSDNNANVKGYVLNSEVYLPLNSQGKLDVSSAIGKGYMNIIKDLGLKKPYIGYVDLVSGEIAEDIAYYFATSEQIPSVVALGVLVDKDEEIINSGGYIIQLMPDCSEDIIAYLEDKISSIYPVTKLLSESYTPEDILDLILGEKKLNVADKLPCRFLCNCSKHRMEGAILSLGKKEILSIIDEQKEAQIQCHFCNKKYSFSEQELLTLIK